MLLKSVRRVRFHDYRFERRWTVRLEISELYVCVKVASLVVPLVREGHG